MFIVVFGDTDIPGVAKIKVPLTTSAALLLATVLV